MKFLKILLLIFLLIPSLILSYLLIPAIIPAIFVVSQIKSPDGEYTAITQVEQYGPSFGPANYTVDLKFHAALLHYKKVRVFEADDGLNYPPEVSWKDSNHLNIKISLRNKSSVLFQSVKYNNVIITYDFIFKDK